MSITRMFRDWDKYRTTIPSGDLNKDHPEYKWVMAVDLDVCTGCSACVAACYAENNLPVVGKDTFAHGQAMHWIRIERYWNDEDVETPHQGAQFIPMMCQQCEGAPCETVCPVGATNHTPDGLNSQIYNRCIGSRYCSANCPYKVRYFNWYDNPEQEKVWPEPLPMQLNPDLTVRTKGIMEKCTFCIQRLRTAQVTARTEGRLVRDGEVLPACVQACPTGAMSFGNLTDPYSEVSKLWRQQQVELHKDKQDKDKAGGDGGVRGYRVLEDLRTYPSVMYLERVRDTKA
jgi:Fe-S-cluster-containing dehydrogenase component